MTGRKKETKPISICLLAANASKYKLTGIRSSSGGHEEVSECPDLSIGKSTTTSGESHLVWDSISSVTLDSGDSPGLLLLGEELGLLGEIDNEDEGKDGKTDSDDTEEEEDCKSARGPSC